MTGVTDLRVFYGSNPKFEIIFRSNLVSKLYTNLTTYSEKSTIEKPVFKSR